MHEELTKCSNTVLQKKHSTNRIKFYSMSKKTALVITDFTPENEKQVSVTGKISKN